jgi:hypothetical protein
MSPFYTYVDLRPLKVEAVDLKLEHSPWCFKPWDFFFFLILRGLNSRLHAF